jgi:hypothetical protein
MKRRIIPALAVVTIVWAGSSAAQDEGHPDRDRRGPPPVALEACTAAVAGDMCAFEGRRGETIEGACSLTPDELLACKPAGGPPGFRKQGADRDAAQRSDT